MNERSRSFGGYPREDPPVMINHAAHTHSLGPGQAPHRPAMERPTERGCADGRSTPLWLLLLLYILIVVLGAACNGSPALASLQLAAAKDEPATETPSLSDLRQAPPAGRAGRDVVFRRLTLDDGLSQSSINCIVQDAQGFMWFGTQDGLNRYDGYEIKVYRHDAENPHSLSNSYVMGCERDQRGAVWIVTRDGTLHRYEPETERFIRYDLALEDPFQQRGSEFRVLHGDGEGRLWIGTFGDGLLRYEPEADTFRSYRHDPEDPTSLSHRIVWQIHEDQEGTIWIGTEAGLNRYDPVADGFVRYPYRDFPPGGYQYDPPVHDNDPAFQPDNPRALGSPAVTRIAEDGEGRLWVGTRYGGLNVLDRETGDFTSYPYDPSFEPEDPGTLSGNSVHSLLVDHLGQLWVGSAHWNVDETRTYARLGVERLDPQTGSIRRFPADPEDPCSLPHDYAAAMYEDGQGTLWFHTFGGGLDIYDRDTGCFEHYVHDRDDEGTLAGDDVTVFYEDEAGGLWIGTGTGGASYFDPGRAKFPSYDVSAESGERLSNNSIWRIALSPSGLSGGGRADVLWVSTFAGLNHWDRRNNSFTFYEIDPKLPDSIGYSIFEDAERHVLWLGTNMGLERAELPAEASTAPENLRFTRILTRSSSSTGYVLTVYPAGEDALWVAQYRVGLSRFDLRSEEIVATYRHNPDDERSLGDDRVMRILPGQDGTLWLTTRGGVEHFDPESETFTHYAADPEDPRSMAATVHAVYEDPSGNVWLGTGGEGLQRLDPTEGLVVAAYGEEDGLPNNVVYSILPDEAGRLWLSTNRGLTRFDPQDESFQSYTSQDGLQSNEFNWAAEFSAPDGELFFGGVNGINAFYPADIGPNPYVPPVVITEIVLGPPRQLPEAGRWDSGSAEGRQVLEAPPHRVEEIELSHRDRILSFEFAALHYALPERNQYAYMLEGFDPDWHEVGTRRFATYTNLPPGRYTFRVKGSNSDGVWNEQGASLTVRVRPPFWGTWWFRAMMGLLLVGGVVAGYRVRVRAIEARSRELERQVAERTQELEAVNAIAAVVSRSLELDDLLCDALDETLTVMGTKAGGIYLLDEAADVLHIAVQRGFRADVVEAIDNLALGEGFSGRVAASGEPLVVKDIAGDARLTRLAVQEEGLRSLAVVPLRAKGNVLGTLFTVTRGYRAFSERDVALLTAIGQQIGVAVDNAALYEDTRSRLAQLTALQETTMAVASTLELGRLLRLIVQQATTLLGADGGILNLVDWATREDEVVAAVGIGALSIGIRSGLETGLSGWVALHDEAVVLNDIHADERIDRAGLLLMESECGKRIVNTAVVPLRVKDQVVGTLVIVNKRGGEVDLDESDLNLLQAFANQAATAIDNARLFEAEQRRAEQFRVISEVGRHITSITSLDSVLQQVVELIQGAFGYDHVHIGLVEGDEVTYRVGAGHLWDDPDFEFEPARLKVGQNGITGWVAATGEPILLPDVSQDPRYVWMRGSETRSELTVPIVLKGEVIGVLDAQSDRLDAFDESDLTVLQSLADQAAIAIENARLYERAQRLAVMEERQRLARELHDSVTQALYGATLYAEATARQLDDGHVALAAEHLRELRDTAQEALREMRLLIFELRPSVLASDGLVNALRARLEAVEERAGLEVAFHADDEIVLPTPVEEGLYRIAQEALNNALKHACARRISVSLERREGSVVLDVVDDGCGFDPATAVPAGGLGLDGIIERAAQMGGELVLDSAPGEGTSVRVEVPR